MPHLGQAPSALPSPRCRSKRSRMMLPSGASGGAAATLDVGGEALIAAGATGMEVEEG